MFNFRRKEDLVMDGKHIQDVYARLAPVYDWTFGILLRGRKRVVRYLNMREGSLLDVGIGTGLHLGDYAPHLRITGVDLSSDMLKKARARVDAFGYKNVESLHEMDAADLKFPTGAFDTVAAMYLLSVVDDPRKVMSELARVCAPGGEVIIVNHFGRELPGLLNQLEGWFEPMANRLGWRSQFRMGELFHCDELRLVSVQDLGTGMFKMVRFQRKEDE